MDKATKVPIVPNIVFGLKVIADINLVANSNSPITIPNANTAWPRPSASIVDKTNRDAASKANAAAIDIRVLAFTPF